MKIAIVTDSTADIPQELAERYSIHVVPNLIVINGKSLEDGRELSRQAFYDRLPSMKRLPTTGTAPPGVYEQLYERLFSSGASRVISIHASGLLSGIINSASTAAQAFAGQVHVVDSGQVTMGLGFQVLAAAQDAAAGLPDTAILAHLAEMSQRVRVIALLDSLEYIRRSGRVSWARASFGALLQIKLLVEVREGRINRVGEARTRSQGKARLLELLSAVGRLEKLAVLHSNAETEALELVESLPGSLPHPQMVVNVTTIIGTHAGPNGLGFAAVMA